MIWPFKREPPPPPPPPVLTYKWFQGGKADKEWHLVVEVPILEQSPVHDGFFSKPGDRQTAVTSYKFHYMMVELTTGSITFRYSDQKLDLDQLDPTAGKAHGWTFLLGAVELVNTYQFMGYQRPNWLGFNEVWDIASVMQNGERLLMHRSAHPHEVMLKFSNQVRMLLAPIQAAQRENPELHVEFYSLATKLGSHDPMALIVAPSVAKKLGKPPAPEPTDEVFRFAAIRDVLCGRYAEFQPPTLLF